MNFQEKIQERIRDDRRRYISAITGQEVGGQQILAERYGLKDRRVVDNWVRDGFAHRWKERLIEDGRKAGVEPLRELFVGRKPKIRSYSTEFGRFVKELVIYYGGVDELAKMMKCPVSAIRRMTEDDGRVIPKHVPAIERVAARAKIPPPKRLWKDVRREYLKWMEQQEAKQLLRRRKGSAI